MLVKKESGIVFNLDEFAWAWFTVNTRAVYFENSKEKHTTQPYKETFGDDNENLALAPFLDMFNHSSKASVEAGINLKYKSSTKGYDIITNSKYKKYDQVFINYGPHGNLRLYIEYGFAEESNQNDFVPVVIDEIKETFLMRHVLPLENKLVEKALEIVRKNELHKNLRIDSTGPSWSIAAAFFVLNSICCSQKSNADNQINVKDQWQNVFMMEDFSDHKEVSSELHMLISAKLNEVTNAFTKIGKNLANTDSPAGYQVASNSFQIAHQLLNLHQIILESAVKCFGEGV